jgi:hypothetical protein
MVDITADRRAAEYRRHADELAEFARREADRDRRRHLLDLALSYLRSADAIAPRPPAESQIFRRP